MSEEKKSNILKLKNTSSQAQTPQQRVAPSAKPEEPIKTIAKSEQSKEDFHEKKLEEQPLATKPEEKKEGTPLRGMPQIIERPVSKPRFFSPERRPFRTDNRPQGERPARFGHNPQERRPFNPNFKPGEQRPRFGQQQYGTNNNVSRETFGQRRPEGQFVPREGGPNRFGENRTFTPREGGPNRFGGNRPFTPREGGPPNRFNNNRPGGQFIPREGGGPNRFGGNRPGGQFIPREGGPNRFGGNKPFGMSTSYPASTGRGLPLERIDRTKKKKTIDKDDRVKDFRQKDDDNLNMTTFVGRIDSQHLEAHAFNDFVAKRKIKDRAKPTNIIKRDIEIYGPMSIKDIAAKMAMRSSDVLAVAKRAGLQANEKENIAEDILHIIVEECGHHAIRIDEQHKAQLELPALNLNPATAVTRPPVVVVVGHVDHGKTSLLDRIRNTSIAKREAGGITQSIGAYQVQLKQGTITFIDTPGHEAFTSMRSRGVKITDIAILVISAEDSIKPQTIEAISHIKAASIPIIVAITKADLHTANIDKVKQDLLSHDIVASEFGGQIECIPVSSLTGYNIDKLLEAVLLQAEVMELKANLDVEARGVVLESKMNPKIGAVATLLVQQGTLKKMSFCIAHIASGKIKAIQNDLGKLIDKATPGMPVEVIGFDTAPPAGTEFGIVEDQKAGMEIVKARIQKHEQETKKPGIVLNLENFVAETLTPNVNLILRADTQGSLEALKFALLKLNNENVELKITLAGIGSIKESDIDLATISDSNIVAFNLNTPASIRKLASDNKITIIEDDIIYRIIENIEQKMLGLVKKEEREVLVGVAKVQQIFSSSKLGNIAGSIVASGQIKKGLIAKVMRNEKLIITTKVTSLKRNKDDAKEVSTGLECGILLEKFNDCAVGDEIHVFKMETVD